MRGGAIGRTGLTIRRRESEAGGGDGEAARGSGVGPLAGRRSSPIVWLLVFFLVPFLIVFKISLLDDGDRRSRPTRRSSISPTASPASSTASRQFTVDNYVWLTEDALYTRAYLSSLWIAAGLDRSCPPRRLSRSPTAWRARRSAWQPTLVMLVILPFWTSFLIRVYAWIGILKKEGLLNQFLLWLGVIDEPLTILNTNWAVYIGIVYSYLPFMVLPLYAALEKIDHTLLEAAADLGCPPTRAFWKITFPLSLPGVIAGCFLVFIPVTGEFVIPDLLGGSDTLMIGKTLWSEFFNNRDWPLASAVAVILLLILVVPIVIFQNQEQRRAERER